MSLRSKLIKNGIATGGQKLVRVLEQLLLVPFFISAWGAEYYGEWVTLTIIPSVLAFADLGFGSASANGFVLKYLAGDKVGAADYRKTGLRIISVVVLAGAVLSALALILLNKYGVLNKTIFEADEVIFAISLMMIARLVGFYNQLSEAYYRVERRAALSINLLSLKALLSLLSGMFVLLFKGGIVEFAMSQLIVSVLFTLFFRWRGLALLNFEDGYFGQYKSVYFEEIWKKGLGYLMSPVWQVIFFQGTTFIVRLTLGPESVAIFNTARTLSRSVNQLFSLVNGAFFPELQFELGVGNLKKAQKLYRLSVGGVFLLGLAGAFLLWILGPWFYQIWTKNQLVVPQSVWLVFIAGILFNALWWTAGMVFRAVNQPFQFALVGVSAAVLSVITSYFLTKEYGLLGAAYGSLVLDVVMAVYVLPVAGRLIGVSLKSYIAGTKSST